MYYYCARYYDPKISLFLSVAPLAEKFLATSEPSGFNYKFGGKELNEELGLNVYDFGARNYAPALGRWMNIDPLAEQFQGWSPYNYTMNNPINLIDPTGMAPDDVYRREGDNFIFVRKNNKDEGTKDHVGIFTKSENGEYVQDIDSNGNLKYESKDIAEGILKDGISFTASPKYYAVGGNSGLTENDILDFAVKLQGMVDKEISGYALSDKAVGGEIKGMMIEPYKGKAKTRSGEWMSYENNRTTSNSISYPGRKPISGHVGGKLGNNRYPFYHFHTHPDASPPSQPDMNAAANNPLVPRFIFNNRFQKLQYGKNGFF